MKNNQLYTIVAISGASVLVLEILGTRIIGPFYGVSLYLWSALISVTLAALSLGYYLGGLWADKSASARRLGAIFLAAGLWFILIPWLKYPILALTETLGLRIAVLLTSLILFFPPLTLLGMISPYAIKLRTKNLNEVGRAAGNLYAVSTVASVAAALLTGFVLIPNVGVSRLTISVGILLALTAGYIYFLSNAKLPKLINTILLIVISVLFIGASWIIPGSRSGENIRFSRNSGYALVEVVDFQNARSLLIDGAIHSIEDIYTGGSLHRHVVVIDITKFLFNSPGEMLLIGLGGGSIAKSFANDGWNVDVVEIDPVVTQAACEFFNFDKNACPVFHQDGRQYLKNSETKYDIIVVDAYGSSAIPFHLVTQEAFALIKNHLKPDGVLALNVETVGWHNVIIHSIAATLTANFSEVIALPASEPPNALGNIVLLAANHPIEIDDDELGHPIDVVGIDAYQHFVVVQRNHAWDNRYKPDTQNAPILTDDLNPIDLWAESINLTARKEIHRYFKDKHYW